MFDLFTLVGGMMVAFGTGWLVGIYTPHNRAVEGDDES